MLKVEVESSSYQTRKVKDFTFHEQKAVAWFMNENGETSKYPKEIAINLDSDNPKPYSPGVYHLHPCSLYADRYGRITVGRVRLVAVKEPAAKVAA